MIPHLKIYFDNEYTWVGIARHNPKGHGLITHYFRLDMEGRWN